jgi:hypothetical protein
LSSYNKQERQTIKSMGDPAGQLFKVLQAYETQEFGGVAELCAALSQPIPLFVTFSCLGTHKGKESLRLDLSETFLFKRFRGVATRLFDEIGKVSPFRFLVILSDTEPTRTWGWEMPQAEVTGYCEMVIEEARDNLPEGWEVVLWSEIEGKVRVLTFEEALEWSENFAHPLLVSEEASHIVARFPDILLREGAREAAVRQVASYALEGKTLEALYPSAVFVQPEFPAHRKDKMYSPLRGIRMPIIHPFALV